MRNLKECVVPGRFLLLAFHDPHVEHWFRSRRPMNRYAHDSQGSETKMSSRSCKLSPPRRPAHPNRPVAAAVLILFLCSYNARTAPPPVPPTGTAEAPDDRPPALPAPPLIFQAPNEREFVQGILPALAKTTGSKQLPPEAPAGPQIGPPPRAAGAQLEMVVPHILCYSPLYFEQKRVEREGHHIVLLQPIISTGWFYADVAALPVKMVLWPPWKKECNTDDPSWGAVQCLPQGTYAGTDAWNAGGPKTGAASRP